MFEARDLPDGQRLTTDICIVGAGAAGIAMALEFIGTGIDVLVLESGGIKPSKDAQSLNAGSVTDPRLHAPPDRHRRRQFGGSVPEGIVRCASLTAVDLDARSYVPRSGWPISFESLSPYFQRALKLCESDDSAKSFDRDTDTAAQPLIEGFQAHHFSADTVDHYGQTVDLGTRFKETLRNSGNVCALLHATVTRLQLNQAGTALDSVLIRTLGGKSITVSATHYVLAAGAFENARLLLANRDVHVNGIGNDNDTVGRYYMCPLNGKVGNLRLDLPPTAIWYGNAVGDGGVRSRRRIALKATQQQQMQIGNFIACLRQGGETGGTLPSRLLPRPIWNKSKSNLYCLEFDAEQQPSPNSRVLLTQERDALGVPKLQIDWNCNVADFETVRRAVALFADDIQRCGAGQFSYDPSQLAEMMTCVGPHGTRHVGTTRMGDDPRTSVVDANCRVHGIANLFITGASVFPTSGVGDPIVSLVALSQRLSDHLKMLEFKINTPLRATVLPTERNAGRAPAPAVYDDRTYNPSRIDRSPTGRSQTGAR